MRPNGALFAAKAHIGPCETASCSLHFGFAGERKFRDLDVKKKMLYEKLEREAGGGASLSELQSGIDKEGRLLTAVEREEAWLYAWALRKYQERRLLESAWEERQDYGDTGDAGAG